MNNMHGFRRGLEEIEFEVIIYYPEIIIKNGRSKHKITDLYVKLSFSRWFKSKRLWLDNISGIRGSRTLEEINAYYTHSHLSGDIFVNYFASFCLGTGPIREEKEEVRRYTTIEEFKYFLLLLDNYLQWESIAGTPYNYISRIGSYEVSPCSTLEAAFIINKFKFKDINFKITDTHIEVINDNKLEQQIFNILKEKKYNSFMCYKNEEGKYISNDHISSQQNRHDLNGRSLNFTFKNKDITFKISNTENLVNYEHNAPNPNFTAEVCKLLSNRITKKHLTRNRVRKEDTVANTQESSTADTILVS